MSPPTLLQIMPIMDDYNKLTGTIDFNKLLVPTPPIVDSTGAIVKGMDNDVSITKAIFQSFYDAPGGMSEEIKEVTYSIGAEYAYANQFFFRGGYFHEHNRSSLNGLMWIIGNWSSVYFIIGTKAIHIYAAVILQLSHKLWCQNGMLAFLAIASSITSRVTSTVSKTEQTAIVLDPT